MRGERRSRCIVTTQIQRVRRCMTMKNTSMGCLCVPDAISLFWRWTSSPKNLLKEQSWINRAFLVVVSKCCASRLCICTIHVNIMRRHISRSEYIKAGRDPFLLFELVWTCSQRLIRATILKAAASGQVVGEVDKEPGSSTRRSLRLEYGWWREGIQLSWNRYAYVVSWDG